MEPRSVYRKSWNESKCWHRKPSRTSGFLSHPFDDRRRLHAVAAAPPLQTELAAGRFQAGKHLGHETGAGSAQRMAVSDGAAPRVHLFHVRPAFAGPSQNHGGERLIDLDPVEVRNA